MNIRKRNLIKILHGSRGTFINHDLIKAIGIPATIFLTELIYRYEYHKEIGELVTRNGEDGYFYLTIEKIEEEFDYGKKFQKKIIDILISKKIIKQLVFGSPPKRYFKIELENLENFIENIIKNPTLNTPNMLQKDQSICSMGTHDLLHGSRSICSMGADRSAPQERIPPYSYNSNNKKKQENILYTAPSPKKLAPKKAHQSKNSDSDSDSESLGSHATSSIRTVHNIKFNFSLWIFEGIPESDLQAWRQLYDKIDVSRELLKMQEWVKSNPSKAKINWRRFISNWFNRAQEKEYNRGSYHSTGQDSKRSQFEMRHIFEDTDRSPRDPSMKLDCSNWKPGDDDK